ncbi:DUF3077 domain-containing protein [Alcaligenaceae bacterium]|nr:DUF3077 domain-containing protein [Alcaligenaceae bacterium]
MFAKLKDDQLTTTQQTFHRCPGGGWPLFCVREGVPTESALEHASNLLSCVHYVAQQAADGPATGMAKALWTVMHMVEAANAIVDASVERAGE